MGSTNEANEIAWCLTTNNWKSRYWIGIASNTSNPPFQLYYSLLGSNNIIKSYSPWSYGSKLIHSFFTGNDHISPIPAGALFEDDDDFPNFPCGRICYCSFSWRVVVQVELVVEKLEVLWPSTSLRFPMNGAIWRYYFSGAKPRVGWLVIILVKCSSHRKNVCIKMIPNILDSPLLLNIRINICR